MLQPIIEETNYMTVASQSQLKDVVLEVQKPNDDEEDGATARFMTSSLKIY